MSVRLPPAPGNPSVSGVLFDALGAEILAEKASALGRAGERAEACLARLRAHGAAPEAGPDHDSRRAELLKQAAEAVHGFFIQRELCGLRRHDAVIRDLGIPRAVLVRLGAK